MLLLFALLTLFFYSSPFVSLLSGFFCSFVIRLKPDKEIGNVTENTGNCAAYLEI
ncbi:hypothetical protein HMPREF2141_00090 [Bacteroides uniformis]|nr:hypothetical protein HMPREF2141_00090 [Bacteroides uniformis]